MLWNVEDAIAHFASSGFTLRDSFVAGYTTDYLSPMCPNTDECVLSVNDEKDFAQDPHIPELLLFAPHTSFTDDSLYQNGKIILQDKASCMPAVVLSPPEDAVVIDATSAPGNKTSHLSAIMEGKGKVRIYLYRSLLQKKLNAVLILNGRSSLRLR